jgi:hypothetical protein
MNTPILIAAGVTLVVAGLIAASVFQKLQENRRAEFIRSYKWPAGLLDKLSRRYPQFKRKETALISQGLRQFFLSYLKSGRRYVAMPSQVADDLWHEFILYTRDYNDFCKKAFGQFLHHTPAVRLSPGQKASNAGLRRVWWHCCKDESINPRKPSRLPLLFALDTKYRIPNGYVYQPDCEALRRNGSAGTQCGGDFSSSSFDGSTEGLGDTSSGSGEGSSSDSGSSDGGSSCGGGCGGGD